MTKRFGHRFQGIVPLMTLIGTFAVGTPSGASEVVVRGLPCNDLCQAWLGLGKQGVTGSVPEENRPKAKTSHSPESVVSDPIPEHRQATGKAGKPRSTAPIEDSSAPERPRAVAAAKRAKTRAREVEADVPLPVPRPTVPNGPPTMAADAPAPAPSGSQDPAPKSVGAATTRDVVAGPTAPDGQVPPPAPDRSAGPIEGLPAPESPRAVAAAKRARPSARDVEVDVPLPVPRPTVPNGPPAVAADAPAPAVPGSQDPAPKSAEAAATRDVVAGPTVPKGQIPPPAPGGHVVSGTAQSRTEPSQVESLPPVAAMTASTAPTLPQASRAAAVSPIVGAPEAPAEAGVTAPTPASTPAGVGDAGARKGSLQPLAELAGGPSPVTIGQISSGLRGTDVHVVVVNVLHHEMRDIDVLCTVRDAQGSQLAEAYAHIADIAPSDVAFGQVVLPSGIAARGNAFTCRIGRVAAASDVDP